MLSTQLRKCIIRKSKVAIALSSSLLARRKAGRDREAEVGTISEKRGGINMYIEAALHQAHTHQVRNLHLKVKVIHIHHLHQWTQRSQEKGGKGRCHLRNTLLNDRITINVEMSNMELRTPILPNRMAFLYISKLTSTHFPLFLIYIIYIFFYPPFSSALPFLIFFSIYSPPFFPFKIIAGL